MEHSAFEAIMIGVNVFIFIMALTAGVLLMSNIIDMVNFANNQAIVGMNGTLAETVGIVNERTYTVAQMLRYYRETIKNIEVTEEIDVQGNIQPIEKDKNTYIFKVKLSENGQERSIKSFMQNENISAYLNEEFTLEYKGLEQDKYVYVFSLKQKNNDEL